MVASRTAGLLLFAALFSWLTYQVKREEPAAMGSIQDLGTLKVGDAAPDFTLPDLEGQQVSLADQRGRVVVLDFWATWCPPCRAVMSVLDSFSRKHQQSGVVVLSINQGESREHIERSLRGRRRDLRILLDEDEEVGDAYGVGAIPLLVMVDREGRIAWMNVGYAQDLDQQLAEQFEACGGPSNEPEGESRGGHMHREPD
jgi:peroxiredoxin